MEADVLRTWGSKRTCDANGRRNTPSIEDGEQKMKKEDVGKSVLA